MSKFKFVTSLPIHKSLRQNYKTLADDIYFIARSLGFHVYIREDTRTNLLVYRIYISGGNIREIPVTIAKKPIHVNKNDNHLFSRIKIDTIGIGNYYGFEIGGNHRFVSSNFIIM